MLGIYLRYYIFRLLLKLHYKYLLPLLELLDVQGDFLFFLVQVEVAAFLDFGLVGGAFYFYST